MSFKTREWMRQRLAMAGTHTYVPSPVPDSCAVCGCGAEYHYVSEASGSASK